MTKQQLASKIWTLANNMRSTVPGESYKNFLLGFMFYKFLSQKEITYLKENGLEPEDFPMELTDDNDVIRENVQKNIGYYISYHDLYSTWKTIKDFSVAETMNAFYNFEKNIHPDYRMLYENIFSSVIKNIPELGGNSSKQTAAINDLIGLVDSIPVDSKEDYDVLGFIYQYCLEKFSTQNKAAAQHFTPSEVCRLSGMIIADHFKDKDQRISLMDCCSGSASLMTAVGEEIHASGVDKNNISYYAQELIAETYNLTRMNLIMRGISVSNIHTRHGDSLGDDWPREKNADGEIIEKPLRVWASSQNPPFSQAIRPLSASDPRFKGYGLPPQSKGDYAFLLHALYHLEPEGIMTIILPHGVLFRGGSEGDIRKALIEKHQIDTIIGLPAGIFMSTGIPTIMMVLKKDRGIHDDVLFIDASKCFIKEGKLNRLRDSDLKRIMDAYKDRKDIKKFCRVVSKMEIVKNEYNLNIPRYVDSSSDPDDIDLYARVFGGIPAAELKKFKQWWNAMPSLFGELFAKKSEGYVELKNKDIDSALRDSEDYKTFQKKISSWVENDIISIFEDVLKNDLSVDSRKAFQKFADFIMQKAEEVGFVDKYTIYELLYTKWSEIESDWEEIRTMGLDAGRTLVPHYEYNKDNESIQKGWDGVLFSPEWIKSTLSVTHDDYSAKVKAIDSRRAMSEAKQSEMDELFESLNEDDQQKLLEEEKTEWSASHVQKVFREMKKEGITDGELFEVAKKISELIDSKKKDDSFVKKAEKELDGMVLEDMKRFNDDTVRELLVMKWIKDFSDKLEKAYGDATQDFINGIKVIANKYDATFSSVDAEIAKVETELAGMLSDLTGNDADIAALQSIVHMLGGDTCLQ